MSSKNLPPTFCSDNSVKQCFSFPNPTIHYIIESLPNSSQNVIYKLYFCCKLFFPKIAVIPVFGVSFQQPSFLQLLNCRGNRLQKVIIPQNLIKDLKFTIFVSDQIVSGNSTSAFSKLILSTISRCTIKCLALHECSITLEEYIMITINIGHLHLVCVSVTRNDESIVPVDELFSLVPKCFHLSYSPMPNEIFKVYTRKTAENLALLKRTTKMNRFLISNIPYILNVAAFSTFINNNSNHNSSVVTKFAGNIGDAAKETFKASVEASLLNFENKIQFYVT